MAVHITDINIACDAALDQDVNQEIGFLGEEDFKAKIEQEELMDQLAREAYGVCEQCNGTGQYMDCDPYKSRMAPCESCDGIGFIKDKDAGVIKDSAVPTTENLMAKVGNTLMFGAVGGMQNICKAIGEINE